MKIEKFEKGSKEKEKLWLEQKWQKGKLTAEKEEKKKRRHRDQSLKLSSSVVMGHTVVMSET